MFEEKKFNIPELKNISTKQLEIHLGLYSGYVKFLHKLTEVETDLMKDAEKNAYALAEVRRRLGFEFCGLRMHEYYFTQWEKEACEINIKSNLYSALSTQFGSLETWQSHFTNRGLTRGIGWTILYFDPQTKRFFNAWVGDHELGQLSGVPIILALDMWEHAYMIDYTPAEKKKYIDAFYENLNWRVMEERFLRI